MQNTKLLLGADFCALSSIERDSLHPLIVNGISKHDLTETSLQRYLLRCATCKPSHYGNTVYINRSGDRESYVFFEHHNIKRDVQIVISLDSGVRILLSVFYTNAMALRRKKLDTAIKNIEEFKEPLIETIKSDQVVQRTDESCFEHIIGNSKAMQKIFRLILCVAETDANVLIVGETGTGKELIARAIHSRSLRNKNRFIPVDCVAIPASLIESELFGFEEGTFTGATKQKRGLLEFAHKGTLFLDEISELDINVQSKLLRVLQERQFRHIGCEQFIHVDIRVIAAMNINPIKAISEGHLRKDLYFRLNVIPIFMPPLRHRKDDIPFLVSHFLKMATQKHRASPKQISPNAMKLLVKYPWYGNVRQLQNVIERLLLLTSGSVIEAADLPAYINKMNQGAPLKVTQNVSLNKARKLCLERFERTYLQSLLRKSHNDIEKAAELASVSSRTIYRMMRRYGRE